MRFVRSVLCVLLVLTLSVGFAVAEETEDKYVVDGEETVLIDRDDFRLYLTGEYESIDNMNGVSGNFVSHLSCVVENKGDEEIGSISYSGVINGWSLGSSHVMSGTNGVRPGTKAKTDIWFTTEDTEVTSYEDLETMELTFEVKDEDYDTMFEVSTGVVHFHATPEDAAATVEETAVEPEAAASDEVPAAEQQAEETESTVEEETYDTLEIGSRGDAVVELQRYLIALGHLDGAADGIYGKGTAGGVRSFQNAEGLEETGIADSETQELLFSKEIPLSTEELLAENLTIEKAHTVDLNAVPTFEKGADFTQPGPGQWFVDNGERETLAVLFYFDLHDAVNVGDSLFDTTYIAYNEETEEYILCFTACETGKDCWVVYSVGDRSVEVNIAEAVDGQSIEAILNEGGFEFALIDKNNVYQIVAALG